MRVPADHVPLGDKAWRPFWESLSKISVTYADGLFVRTDTENTFENAPDAPGYKVAGLQVVGPRITGWTAPTGTRSRAAFDPATATAEEMGQRLAALIDDVATHGQIGP